MWKNCCNRDRDDSFSGDSNDCPSCDFPRKVKGRFGLAWVSESPECPCQEPVGWQVEFLDTPSKVEQKCQEMVRWINCPPLPRCDPCPPVELCCNTNFNASFQKCPSPKRKTCTCNKPQNLQCTCLNKERREQMQQQQHQQMREPRKKKCCCCENNRQQQEQREQRYQSPCCNSRNHHSPQRRRCHGLPPFDRGQSNY